MSAASLAGLAREILASLLALLADWRCAACGEPVERLRGCVCAACRLALRQAQPRCPACARRRAGEPAAAASPAGPAGAPGSPCLRCARRCERPRVVAAWDHGGAARTLVHALKYGRRREVAEALAEALWSDQAVRAVLSDVEALVPVPVEPLRRRQRGFNQAALLAEGLARRAGGLPVVDGLARAAGGLPQAALGGAARRRALRGLVRARRAARWRLRGRRVALVDDVVTTGSTVREAARALRAAGADVVAVVACTRSVATVGDR